jgi:hypothetical protein
VIYLDTELKFDACRLVEVAEERYPVVYNARFNAHADREVAKLLEDVKVLCYAPFLTHDVGRFDTGYLIRFDLIRFDSIRFDLFLSSSLAGQTT